MQIRRPGLFLGLLAPVGLMLASSCNGDSPGIGEFEPYRTGWMTVVDAAPFPYLDGEGNVQIGSVLVGGSEYNDNFANRGDVIVKFTGPDNQITVEMRKFTFAETEEDAQTDFDKLFPWIYSNSPTSPKQPAEMDPAADCILSGWQNGCGVRVWYDGQIQPGRLGADIRVTLPASYRQELIITTEDNTLEDTYQDRGNVCVENANASVDVGLVRGVAYVIASPDLTPGPSCSAAEIQNCEEYEDPDTMQPAAWDPNCACQAFGSFVVETYQAGASNISVDLPATVWASLNLDNKAPADEAAACTANIDIPGVVIDEGSADKDYQSRGEINHPSDAAIAGGGFNVRLSSESCGPRQFTEDPSDYGGPDGEEDQESEERGNLLACSGCLRQTGSCEDLMPWNK